jgi:hypothetical protein
LKEWFTIYRLVVVCFWPQIMHNTEESVSLYQVATSKHWGTDCSLLMEAILAYSFDRHFQIARATVSRYDLTLTMTPGWFIAEKTGNMKDCIEIKDQKHRALESYMRAAPPPGSECFCFFVRGGFFGVEPHHQHLQPRQNMAGYLKYMSIHDVMQAEEGYRSSAEWVAPRSISLSSADGLTHMFPEHAMVAMIRALASLSAGARNVDPSWLDDLPPANTTTLHCTSLHGITLCTPRVLVSEVFELQGRHADAIRFAQTDLQDDHNFNVPSKLRAGRVLGRCHAAIGQHTLSVSAFDAAIELAQSRKLLLSEALSVRGRAAVGRGAGATEGNELHWDEETGKQRLAEVMGRMQGPSEVLERVLLLPQYVATAAAERRCSGAG